MNENPPRQPKDLPAATEQQCPDVKDDSGQGRVMIRLTRKLAELKTKHGGWETELQGLSLGFTELEKGLIGGTEELFCPAKELIGGTKELFGPAKELLGGAEELFCPAKELLGGAEELFGPAKELIGGTKELFCPAKELIGGTKELFCPAKELFGGTKELFFPAKQFLGVILELFFSERAMPAWSRVFTGLLRHLAHRSRRKTSWNDGSAAHETFHRRVG